MTTPLIVLSILVVPTLVFALIGMVAKRPALYRAGARFGFAAAFAFFSTGHFIMTDAMAAMLPNGMPQPRLIVIWTGVLEAALALALLVPRFRRPAGIACLVVLVVFFPVNIYAAVNHVGPGGHAWGPVYLAVRAPLQLVLIAWGYWFFVRPETTAIPARSSERDNRA